MYQKRKQEREPRKQMFKSKCPSEYLSCPRRTLVWAFCLPPQQVRLVRLMNFTKNIVYFPYSRGSFVFPCPPFWKHSPIKQILACLSIVCVKMGSFHFRVWHQEKLTVGADLSPSSELIYLLSSWHHYLHYVTPCLSLCVFCICQD